MKKNYIQPDFELLSISLSSDFLNTSPPNTSVWENEDTDPNGYDDEWA